MPTVGIGDLQGGIGPELGVPAGLVEAVVMARAHQDEVGHCSLISPLMAQVRTAAVYARISSDQEGTALGAL